MSHTTSTNVQIDEIHVYGRQGFTFLELLLVAVTIGILVAIALPAYHNYTLRAQVTEAITITDGMRQSVATYYKYTGHFPSDNFASGLPAPTDIKGNYVHSVTIEDGAIHVRFDENTPNLSDHVVSLRPVFVPNAPTAPLHFVCGYANETDSNLRVSGTNKTTVPENWLPSACRDKHT